jgi:uncharacterized membrane protein
VRHRPTRKGRNTDERGATLILVAVGMTLLLGAGALSVDLGIEAYVNRSLQATADAGALDAARYLSVSGANLTVQAQRAATDNNSNATMTASEGIWSSGTFTVPGSCVPTVPPAHPSCNAVKVTASSTIGHLFTSGNAALSRSAIASVNPDAGFSIGSYLASFSTQQSAVLNVLLGSLGSSVSLSAVGYTGLANSYVTVQQLIDASGGVLTTSNVLTTSLSGTQWVSFLNNAMATQAALVSCSGSTPPYACTANTTLTALGHSVNASTSAELCQLVSINGSTCSSGTLAQAALLANVNVLQTLTTEAQLANGTHALDITSALNILGVSAQLTATLIQVPQVAYGPVGTSASTSQVNVNLALSVAGIGLLNIPITGADGTATLATITCSNNAMTSTKINASTTAISNAVTLAGIQIATLIVNGATTTLGYTIAPPTPATVAAGTNPVTVSTTTPTFNGLSLLNNALVGTLLNTTLAPILGPVLQALGVSVAGAQVADLSTDCGSVSIVQ